MHLAAGVAMIVAGASFACVVMFGLWGRLSGLIALGLVGLSGAVVGAGGLLVQHDVGAASWIVTIFAFVVMTPVHARLVFGSPDHPTSRWLPRRAPPRRKEPRPVSDPSDRTTVAAPASATTSAGASAPPAGEPSTLTAEEGPAPPVQDRPGPPTAGSTAPAPSKRGARARQARVVVRKLGPWSVLKISFLFYVCVLVVFLGAMVILYGTLGAIGALDSLTRLIRDLFADQSFEIHGDWLLTRGLAVGFGLVVLWTLINVFVVFLYNLLSDIVGGIEVTLSERRYGR